MMLSPVSFPSDDVQEKNILKNRLGNDAPLRGACLLPLQHTRSHRQHP